MRTVQHALEDCRHLDGMETLYILFFNNSHHLHRKSSQPQNEPGHTQNPSGCLSISIFNKPTTHETLFKRDFLPNTSSQVPTPLSDDVLSISAKKSQPKVKEKWLLLFVLQITSKS